MSANLSLDFKQFGNGFGLCAPFFDQNFYWLVEDNREDRRGDLYTFMHGFGTQLRSHQWTHPRAGERRFLCGRWFVVQHSIRAGRFPLRVEVAWSMVELPKDVDAAHAAINALKNDLDSGRLR